MVYLDYAATMPILPEVIEAMGEAEKMFYGNASALHTPGHLALNQIEETRKLFAETIGAEKSEIVFTSGATESNNTVIHTFAGCEIETSPLEHHSLIEPARLMRGKRRPKLYSYMYANNETGEILSFPKITEVEEEASAEDFAEMMEAKDDWGHPLVTDKRSYYKHSDLTQVLGKVPINVHKMGLDYATFSAHKIGGPVGVGILYVKKGVPFRPLLIGGNQEGKRRGGTYNTVGIIGLRKALEVMRSRKTWEQYDTKVRSLRDELARRIIEQIPGSSLNTDTRPGKSLPNILNVSFHAAEGESIQLYLDAEGIIVSTGSACAAGDIKPSHVLMAKTGDAEIAHSSVRFSLSPDNTVNDIDRVMQVLPGIIERLQGISTIK